MAEKSTGGIRRAVRVISAAVICIGLLIILLSMGLLIFGAKAEGRLIKKENFRGRKYHLTYVYTVDGNDYEYELVRKIYHDNDDSAKTQKISYLRSHPSVAFTERMVGVGMLAAALGGYGYLIARYGVRKKGTPAQPRRSPQWNNYLNKVKSGGNKQE